MPPPANIAQYTDADRKTEAFVEKTEAPTLSERTAYPIILFLLFLLQFGGTILVNIKSQRLKFIVNLWLLTYFRCAIFRYFPGSIPVLLRNSSASLLALEYPTAFAI